MANEKMKVSEWLSKHMDSHAIVDSTRTKAKFEKDTGVVAEWHDMSKAQMAHAIDARGKGGELYGSDDARYVGGLAIAEWCARKFIRPDYCHGKLGMGFAFWQCVDDLKKAGF